MNKFRQRLCPFMKAIQKTTNSRPLFEREPVCDEIIRAARLNQTINHLSHEWYRYIRNPLNRTLDCEHGSLIATNLE